VKSKARLSGRGCVRLDGAKRKKSVRSRAQEVYKKLSFPVPRLSLFSIHRVPAFFVFRFLTHGYFSHFAFSDLNRF
jgi:hypothetical protein